MNKKIIYLIFAIFSHQTITPMTVIPQLSHYAKMPYRTMRNWIFGKDIAQSYWEANELQLNQELEQFKTASSINTKKAILEKVMNSNATEYETQVLELQKKIAELKSNYRKTISYIMEKFQNNSPDHTIVYFPDSKLVTLYSKDTSDEEKATILSDLLKKAKDISSAKNSSANNPAATQAGGVHIHVHESKK